MDNGRIQSLLAHISLEGLKLKKPISRDDLAQAITQIVANYFESEEAKWLSYWLNITGAIDEDVWFVETIYDLQRILRRKLEEMD